MSYLFLALAPVTKPRAFGNTGGAPDEVGVLRPAELADPWLGAGLAGEPVALPCALRARAFFDGVLIESRLKVCKIKCVNPEIAMLYKP